MELPDELDHIAKHLMGHKEVDGIGVNDVCRRAAAHIRELEQSAPDCRTCNDYGDVIRFGAIERCPDCTEDDGRESA